MQIKHLRIGAVAKETGFSVQTIRFYEEQGIVQNDYRSSNGYRYFHPKTVLILRLVKHYKDLTFSLKEIKALLQDYGVEMKCADIRAETQQKIAVISAEIKRLEGVKSALEKGLTIAIKCPANDKCLDNKECFTKFLR